MFCKKFEIEKNSVTGITGSGGKTSLMFSLAEELSEYGKVLVTTTTKIYEPDKNRYEKLFLTKTGEVFEGRGKNIFVLGGEIKNEKLISPKEEDILKIKDEYDYVLYEGDGSKQKFMKFWNEYEPCILSFTDTVIGVGNIKALGLSFSEENVHRYNMYMDKNNKFYRKKYIDFEILKSYLKEGEFFKNFNGKKIIFLNGVENFEEIETALKIKSEIKNMVFGSVKMKKIYSEKNISAVVMGSGKSERFGKNKLLEKIDGVPMIEILLKKLEKLPFKNIFVAYKDKEIFEICRKYKVTPLENKKYFLGQSESIKLGAENIKDEDIMFFTGDMPFLKEETIFEIMNGFDGRITIPVIEGKRFSPVIFPNRYKNVLLSLLGDVGGREIIKNEKDLNFMEFFDKKQFMDIDTKEDFEKLKAVVKMTENKIVVVRGGGDLASGTINRLHNMGFKVLVLEIPNPNFIRRKVCYGEAVYEKEFLLEGAVSKLAENTDEIKNIWAEGKIPVYIDPNMEIVSEIKPLAVIDAIIAKKNLGMKKDIAPVTIALGPGFTAGKDADAVIETQRGHNLGRIIFEGCAAENTGIPGIIKGYGKERVIHAPASGTLKIVHDIGSIVKKDEIIAYIDETPVPASLTGLIRGMIREGSVVEKGLKIIDIDPREEELKNCYTISDKARTISGGVAEALFYLMNRL